MFQKFFGKMVKIKETSFLSTRGMILIFGNCIMVHSTSQLKVLRYSGGRKLVSSLVERKDVSFILTIFPKNFWNK